jgi:hypothetical protein
MYVAILHETLAYMLLLHIDYFSQNNPDVKGLYGVLTMMNYQRYILKAWPQVRVQKT